MGTYTGTPVGDTITQRTLSSGVRAQPAGTRPSPATDVIDGGDGNDDINGGGGADTITGGTGQDEIMIEGAGSTVYGGEGADRLYVTYKTTGEPKGAVTRLYCGDGNDIVGGGMASPDFDFPDVTLYAYGEGGNDILEVPTGYVDVTYSVGENVLVGGPGDDAYRIHDARDTIVEQPGEGYDSVNAFASYGLPANVEKLALFASWDDIAWTGIGNDRANVIVGGEVRNTIEGRGGNDVLYGDGSSHHQELGETDADTIRGGAGNDLIYGGTGREVDDWDAADELYGDDGNDRIFAQFGDDEVYGGTGADELAGQAGNDLLVGGDGNDRLGGGTGNDRLYGGGGGDVLSGRSGADLLYGEGGNDRFVYETTADSTAGAAGRDTIIGFGNVGPATGDVIEIAAIDADAASAGNQAFAFIGAQAPTKAGELGVSASGDDTLIRGEVDGKAGADFAILVSSITAEPGDWAAQDFIL